MGMPTYQGLQENRLNEQFIMGMLFPHCSRASGTLGNYLVREVGALRGFPPVKIWKSSEARSAPVALPVGWLTVEKNPPPPLLPC